MMDSGLVAICNLDRWWFTPACVSSDDTDAPSCSEPETCLELEVVLVLL